MGQFLTSLANLFRGIASLGIVAFVGIASWLGYSVYREHYQLSDNLREAKEQLAEKSAEVDRLNIDLADKIKKIEQLQVAMRLLKVDHRLAEMIVLSQEPPGAAGDQLTTRIEFVEVNEQGQRIEEPRQFAIKGDTAYIDAWVVKFADSLVESGDPLRATSICLFRRLFGEFQEPTDGFSIDPVGTRPAAYARGGGSSDFERQIWADFWEYANNPAKAEKQGIRAAHGEAPSIKLQPGRLYKIQLRASGGLSISSDDLPPGRLPVN